MEHEALKGLWGLVEQSSAWMRFDNFWAYIVVVATPASIICYDTKSTLWLSIFPMPFMHMTHYRSLFEAEPADMAPPVSSPATVLCRSVVSSASLL